MKSIFCSDDLSRQCSTWQEGEKWPSVCHCYCSTYNTHTHNLKKNELLKNPRERNEMPFFHLQQYDSTKKETKHYLKIEDTHTLIREKGRVCMCVCPGVCDYFIFHCNLNGIWRSHAGHTHRQTGLPLSHCCAPQMPLRDCNNSWSQCPACWTRRMEYTGQMSWLHTHLFVCAGVSKGRSGGQYKNKRSTNTCV